MRRHPPTRLAPLFCLVALAFFTGCGKPSADSPAPASSPAAGVAGEPKTFRLQTDWYAQAEHGGYYQAVAKGFYRELGYELGIDQGGPGAFGVQKVAANQIAFSMGRSDDLILAIDQGLPVVIITALMEHDPQALLLHEENPVNSFADLDGKTVMAGPGAAWVAYIQNKHNVRMNLIPVNYGLSQFMADKNFIQQCFITNEPYFVLKNGGKPKTLLIAGSGYDPYRVIFTSRKYLRENPAAVRAFVDASARGWADFLGGDPTPGMALISKDNDKMDVEFMRFSIDAMNRYKLVAGDPTKGERIGLITRERIEAQVASLVEAKLLSAPIPAEKIATFDFPPPGP